MYTSYPSRLHPAGWLLTALTFAAAQYASAEILWVANNGIDSASCGHTVATSCRSLGAAIDNAAAGDTIQVGPGRYGDLNGDGTLDDPGEEHPDFALGCVVCIDKPVRVLSQEGATVTTIDVSSNQLQPPATLHSAVEIRASGVVFGLKDRGFTITGASVNGVLVFNAANPVNRVQVAGNVAVRNHQSGFLFQTDGPSVLVSDNFAADNDSDGFTGTFLSKVTDRPGPVVRDNVAVNNGLGFNIAGNNIFFTRNVANKNIQGVFAHGERLVIRDNTVSNSGREGIIMGDISSTPRPDTINVSEFTGNSIIGNRWIGILFPLGIGQFHSNNIFGNGSSFESFTGDPPNCGTLNTTGRRIFADNNFWGRAIGPGPDPADNACNGRGSVTVTAPTAPGAFPIRP